jgi:hypothetical protein|tara:strand:+ start:731 stop:1090 length:360 start_codon:yes stop_codon:yes gene_type:complete
MAGFLQLSGVALNCHSMVKGSEQPDEPRKRRGIGPFWLGILTGILITAVIFHRDVLELLGDATGNVLPVIFMPGLLELTLGMIGFGIVLLVNHLLRREQSDEWVLLDEGENEGSREEDS